MAVENIELILAIVGLVLEIAGLMVLLGKDDAISLRSLSQKKLDGLDEWQNQIDSLIAGQRKRHLLSSVFIVLGICLQTFPEYLCT